jgi:hypothetical protein
MNGRHDPELDDILQDQELHRIGTLLSAAVRPEPPVDEAFRSGLRRQLMQQAWEMGEGRPSWFKRAFAPPGLAWIGATAGLLLIASVVIFMLTQPAGVNSLVVSSSMDGSHGVALQQPILVSFNQPMDHPSTEAAVQIAPATNVSFAWSASSNTLSVLPTSGNLAPNTQYQVTIGPSAKTAAGQPLASAQTITFVTQPPAPPPPSPSPTPRAPATPSSLLTGEHQLAALAGLASSAVQWSADSSTIYFVDSKGALNAVGAKAGDVKVVAPDGASSPSIAPAGDRLAYIRGGKIEVLTFATGTTVEVEVTPAASVVGWTKEKLVWSTHEAVYTEGATRPARLADLSTGTGATVLSFAPDGTHAVYRQDQKLNLLDLATAKSTRLDQAGGAFYGWSPSGTQLIYAGTDSLIISDLQGNNVGTLAGAEASWSTQDAILLGGDTDLYQVRSDGTGSIKLANGTYHTPVWAPNGTAFAFFRGNALWTATAPPLPPQPNPMDQAAAVVNSFLQVRQNNKPDQATTYLDDSGKQAYTGDGLSLVINGEPHFSRFYVLTQTLTGTQPDTATFVVRIVLTRGKLDVSDFEETLTLVRDAATKPFLIHNATAGAHRDLGKGAEVVGVVVAADSIKVTFDSDLDPATVADGVQVLDSKGKPVDITTAYSNRTVTITGVDLKPGSHYKLVVLTTVRDVGGHNVASEYDLELLAPALKNKGNQRTAGGLTASPVPTLPAPTPTLTPS